MLDIQSLYDVAELESWSQIALQQSDMNQKPSKVL